MSFLEIIGIIVVTGIMAAAIVAEIGYHCMKVQQEKTKQKELDLKILEIKNSQQ